MIELPVQSLSLKSGLPLRVQLVQLDFPQSKTLNLRGSENVVDLEELRGPGHVYATLILDKGGRRVEVIASVEEVEATGRARLARVLYPANLDDAQSKVAVR